MAENTNQQQQEPNVPSMPVQQDPSKKAQDKGGDLFLVPSKAVDALVNMNQEVLDANGIDFNVRNYLNGLSMLDTDPVKGAELIQKEFNKIGNPVLKDVVPKYLNSEKNEVNNKAFRNIVRAAMGADVDKREEEVKKVYTKVVTGKKMGNSRPDDVGGVVNKVAKNPTAGEIKEQLKALKPYVQDTMDIPGDALSKSNEYLNELKDAKEKTNKQVVKIDKEYKEKIKNLPLSKEGGTILVNQYEKTQKPLKATSSFLDNELSFVNDYHNTAYNAYQSNKGAFNKLKDLGNKIKEDAEYFEKVFAKYKDDSTDYVLSASDVKRFNQMQDNIREYQSTFRHLDNTGVLSKIVFAKLYSSSGLSAILNVLDKKAPSVAATHLIYRNILPKNKIVPIPADYQEEPVKDDSKLETKDKPTRYLYLTTTLNKLGNNITKANALGTIFLAIAGNLKANVSQAINTIEENKQVLPKEYQNIDLTPLHEYLEASKALEGMKVDIDPRTLSGIIKDKNGNRIDVSNFPKHLYDVADKAYKANLSLGALSKKEDKLFKGGPLYLIAKHNEQTANIFTKGLEAIKGIGGGLLGVTVGLFDEEIVNNYRVSAYKYTIDMVDPAAESTYGIWRGVGEGVGAIVGFMATSMLLEGIGAAVIAGALRAGVTSRLASSFIMGMRLNNLIRSTELVSEVNKTLAPILRVSEEALLKQGSRTSALRTLATIKGSSFGQSFRAVGTLAEYSKLNTLYRGSSFYTALSKYASKGGLVGFGAKGARSLGSYLTSTISHQNLLNASFMEALGQYLDNKRQNKVSTINNMIDGLYTYSVVYPQLKGTIADNEKVRAKISEKGLEGFYDYMNESIERASYLDFMGNMVLLTLTNPIHFGRYGAYRLLNNKMFRAKPLVAKVFTPGTYGIHKLMASIANVGLYGISLAVEGYIETSQELGQTYIGRAAWQQDLSNYKGNTDNFVNGVAAFTESMVEGFKFWKVLQRASNMENLSEEERIKVKEEKEIFWSTLWSSILFSGTTGFGSMIKGIKRDMAIIEAMRKVNNKLSSISGDLFELALDENVASRKIQPSETSTLGTLQEEVEKDLKGDKEEIEDTTASTIEDTDKIDGNMASEIKQDSLEETAHSVLHDILSTLIPQVGKDNINLILNTSRSFVKSFVDALKELAEDKTLDTDTKIERLAYLIGEFTQLGTDKKVLDKIEKQVRTSIKRRNIIGQEAVTIDEYINDYINLYENIDRKIGEFADYYNMNVEGKGLHKEMEEFRRNRVYGDTPESIKRFGEGLEFIRKQNKQTKKKIRETWDSIIDEFARDKVSMKHIKDNHQTVKNSIKEKLKENTSISDDKTLDLLADFILMNVEIDFASLVKENYLSSLENNFKFKNLVTILLKNNLDSKANTFVSALFYNIKKSLLDKHPSAKVDSLFDLLKKNIIYFFKAMSILDINNIDIRKEMDRVIEDTAKEYYDSIDEEYKKENPQLLEDITNAMKESLDDLMEHSYFLHRTGEMFKDLKGTGGTLVRNQGNLFYTVFETLKRLVYEERKDRNKFRTMMSFEIDALFEANKDLFEGVDVKAIKAAIYAIGDMMFVFANMGNEKRREGFDKALDIMSENIFNAIDKLSEYLENKKAESDTDNYREMLSLFQWLMSFAETPTDKFNLGAFKKLVEARMGKLWKYHEKVAFFKRSKAYEERHDDQLRERIVDEMFGTIGAAYNRDGKVVPLKYNIIDSILNIIEKHDINSADLLYYTLYNLERTLMLIIQNRNANEKADHIRGGFVNDKNKEILKSSASSLLGFYYEDMENMKKKAEELKKKLMEKLKGQKPDEEAEPAAPPTTPTAATPAPQPTPPPAAPTPTAKTEEKEEPKEEEPKKEEPKVIEDIDEVKDAKDLLSLDVNSINKKNANKVVNAALDIATKKMKEISEKQLDTKDKVVQADIERRDLIDKIQAIFNKTNTLLKTDNNIDDKLKEFNKLSDEANKKILKFGAVFSHIERLSNLSIDDKKKIGNIIVLLVDRSSLDDVAVFTKIIEALMSKYGDAAVNEIKVTKEMLQNPTLALSLFISNILDKATPKDILETLNITESEDIKNAFDEGWEVFKPILHGRMFSKASTDGVSKIISVMEDIRALDREINYYSNTAKELKNLSEKAIKDNEYDTAKAKKALDEDEKAKRQGKSLYKALRDIKIALDKVRASGNIDNSLKEEIEKLVSDYDFDTKIALFTFADESEADRLYELFVHSVFDTEIERRQAEELAKEREKQAKEEAKAKEREAKEKEREEKAKAKEAEREAKAREKEAKEIEAKTKEIDNIDQIVSKGEYREAIRKYDKLLEFFSKKGGHDAEIEKIKAKKLQVYDKMVEAINNTIKEGKISDGISMYKRTIAFFEERQDAKEHIDKANSIIDELHKSMIDNGKEEMSKGQYKAAKSIFQQALKVKDTEEVRKLIDEADKEMKELLKKKPEDKRVESKKPIEEKKQKEQEKLKGKKEEAKIQEDIKNQLSSIREILDEYTSLVNTIREVYSKTKSKDKLYDMLNPESEIYKKLLDINNKIESIIKNMDPQTAEAMKNDSEFNKAKQIYNTNITDLLSGIVASIINDFEAIESQSKKAKDKKQAVQKPKAQPKVQVKEAKEETVPEKVEAKIKEEPKIEEKPKEEPKAEVVQKLSIQDVDVALLSDGSMTIAIGGNSISFTKGNASSLLDVSPSAYDTTYREIENLLKTGTIDEDVYQSIINNIEEDSYKALVLDYLLEIYEKAKGSEELLSDFEFNFKLLVKDLINKCQ